MKSMNEEQFKIILGIYSKKGYKIIKAPEIRDEVPPFLISLNYCPDYIIKSDSISYVVELSSSKNPGDESRSKKIIEEVETHKGWEYILVVAEPESKIEKLLPGINLQDEIPGHHIKLNDEKPVPESKLKKTRPLPDYKPPKNKRTSEIKLKYEPPSSEVTRKRKKDKLTIEMEDEQSDDLFEPEIELPEIEFEQEDDELYSEPEAAVPVKDSKTKDIKTPSPQEPVDEPVDDPVLRNKPDEPEPEVETAEKPETGTQSPITPASTPDPLSLACLNFNSMIDSEQSGKYLDASLLYGWVLLESMLRKLLAKEFSGTDTGFLLADAVAGNIIDSSELAELKNIYLLRNKTARGEFAAVTGRPQLEPLTRIINKLYAAHFS